jgi:hypothetical protein
MKKVSFPERRSFSPGVWGLRGKTDYFSGCDWQTWLFLMKFVFSVREGLASSPV